VQTCDLLSGLAILKQDSSFADFLPGETNEEKITFYLRNIISMIAPSHAPDVVNWNNQKGGF